MTVADIALVFLDGQINLKSNNISVNLLILKLMWMFQNKSLTYTRLFCLIKLMGRRHCKLPNWIIASKWRTIKNFPSWLLLRRWLQLPLQIDTQNLQPQSWLIILNFRLTEIQVFHKHLSRNISTNKLSISSFKSLPVRSQSQWKCELTNPEI